MYYIATDCSALQYTSALQQQSTKQHSTVLTVPYILTVVHASAENMSVPLQWPGSQWFWTTSVKGMLDWTVQRILLSFVVTVGTHS